MIVQRQRPSAPPRLAPPMSREAWRRRRNVCAGVLGMGLVVLVATWGSSSALVAIPHLVMMAGALLVLVLAARRSGGAWAFFALAAAAGGVAVLAPLGYRDTRWTGHAALALIGLLVPAILCVLGLAWACPIRTGTPGTRGQIAVTGFLVGTAAAVLLQGLWPAPTLGALIICASAVSLAAVLALRAVRTSASSWASFGASVVGVVCLLGAGCVQIGVEEGWIGAFWQPVALSLASAGAMGFASAAIMAARTVPVVGPTQLSSAVVSWALWWWAPHVIGLVALAATWGAEQLPLWLVWVLVGQLVALSALNGRELRRTIMVLEETSRAARESHDGLERGERLRMYEVAALCHDVRHHLASVRAATTDLARAARDHGASSHRVDLAYERVSGAINAQHEMLSAMLDVSLLRHDKLVPQLEHVSLAAVSAPVVEEFLPRFVERGCRLVQEYSGDVPLVIADAARFRRVLRNMLANALRFVVPGNGVVSLRLSVHEGMVSCCVEDNGCGISPEHLATLQQRFAQVRRGELAPGVVSHEGSGLGLVLSAKLMHLMGGGLCVDSSLGQGTCVCLCLPVGHETGGARAPGGAGSLFQPLAGWRAVVIDDDGEQSTQMGQVVRAMGAHDVRMFSALKDALVFLHTPGVSVDLVVVADTLDGAAFSDADAACLREAQGGAAAARVLCCSSQCDVGIVGASSDATPLFHARVPKHVQLAELVAIMRRVSASR